MEWLEAVTRAVSEGKTGAQTAIPDGKFIGDLYFITTTKNEIIKIFCWDGKGWIGEEKLKEKTWPNKNLG